MAQTTTYARTARLEAAFARRIPLGLVSVGLLAIVAYATTPFDFWVGDDYNYLYPKDLDRVLSFFNPATPYRAFYRPLNWTSWAIDYALWGRSPFGWHVTSILFHTVTTITVALIAWFILKNWGVAFFAGALFAAHPSHPETVSWIGGRADEVCGLFYFPALLLFVAFLRQRVHGRSSPILYAGAFVMAIGAIMGKEMGVTMPVALLLTDVFFFTPANKLKNIAYWRQRALLHIPFFALVAAYALMRYYLVAAKIVTNTYSGPSQISLQGLLNAAASNVLLAVGAWNGPQLAQAIPGPIKLLIILAALGAGLVLLRWLGRNALYCLLWVALTLLPTSNLSASRWLYIPSFGVCLLAALIVWKASQRQGGGQARWNTGYVLGGLLLLAWSAGVLYQNVMWYRAGEEARSILAQIKSLEPDPSRPTTIYFAGAPSNYHSALLFNTGLPSAMSYIYTGTGIELHEVEQPLADPVIEDALKNPPRLKQNPVFMGYKAGKVQEYPSIEALLKAGTGK